MWFKAGWYRAGVILAILGRSRAGLVLGLVGWWFLSGRGRGFGRGLVLKREKPRRVAGAGQYVLLARLQDGHEEKGGGPKGYDCEAVFNVSACSGVHAASSHCPVSFLSASAARIGLAMVSKPESGAAFGRKRSRKWLAASIYFCAVASLPW